MFSFFFRTWNLLCSIAKYRISKRVQFGHCTILINYRTKCTILQTHVSLSANLNLYGEVPNTHTHYCNLPHKKTAFPELWELWVFFFSKHICAHRTLYIKVTTTYKFSFGVLQVSLWKLQVWATCIYKYDIATRPPGG